MQRGVHAASESVPRHSQAFCVHRHTFGRHRPNLAAIGPKLAHSADSGPNVAEVEPDSVEIPPNFWRKSGQIRSTAGQRFGSTVLPHARMDMTSPPESWPTLRARGSAEFAPAVEGRERATSSSEIAWQPRGRRTKPTPPPPWAQHMAQLLREWHPRFCHTYSRRLANGRSPRMGCGCGLHMVAVGRTPCTLERPRTAHHWVCVVASCGAKPSKDFSTYRQMRVDIASTEDTVSSGKGDGKTPSIESAARLAQSLGSSWR